jgi:hypothetical protein
MWDNSMLPRHCALYPRHPKFIDGNDEKIYRRPEERFMPRASAETIAIMGADFGHQYPYCVGFFHTISITLISTNSSSARAPLDLRQQLIGGLIVGYIPAIEAVPVTPSAQLSEDYLH